MAGLFDKANEFLKSDQGEQVSDAALDRAADAADRVSGGGHKDAVEKARATADEHLGDD